MPLQRLRPVLVCAYFAHRSTTEMAGRHLDDLEAKVGRAAGNAARGKAT
jgi:hypothetical protein